MSESTTVKLIHDSYENEMGVLYDEKYEIESDKTKILENLPAQINDVDINVDRHLTIYTWGIKKDRESVGCPLIFDLTKFQTKIDRDIDVSTITGLTDIIQDSIVCHPKFLELMEMVVTKVENDSPPSIAFICNHGKHRSVAWAELLKKLYYTKSTIRHLCKNRWFPSSV
jgi:hypothetical protein